MVESPGSVARPSVVAGAAEMEKDALVRRSEPFRASKT
jgi:hypothetical protein